MNLSRGLGTALGVAVPTLALHLAVQARHPAAGPHLAMLALVVVALATATTTMTAEARSGPRAPTTPPP